jgi:hypothetical protein
MKKVNYENKKVKKKKEKRKKKHVPQKNAIF